LALLTVTAAIFRFSTLGVQHYWIDESVTVALLRLSFGGMLHTIPLTESTPPLYYVIAWVWTKLFGTSELGLRSLSALAGTAAVPVCYAAAAQFASRRVALFTTALAAVSPMLVWYSQEARAYSLLMLLSALTVLFFGEALRDPKRSTIGLWSVASVLALATHYFAGFLVLGEAIWLLAQRRARGRVALACVPIVTAVGALAPLAEYQHRQGHLTFIGTTALASRIRNTAEVFVAGQTGPLIPGVTAAGLVLVGVAVALLVVCASRPERRRLLPTAAVGACGLGVPLVLAVAGWDYVLARNLLPVWLPIAILVACGFAVPVAGRFRIGAGIALCLYSTAICVAVPLTAGLRRESITAQLLHLHNSDAVVGITYVTVPGGEQRTGFVQCPSGYASTQGYVSWLPGSGGHLRVAPGSRPGTWNARGAANGSGTAVYQLTVVCARTP